MRHTAPPEFFDFEITGIDAYAEVLSGAQIQLAQLLPGQLRGHHTRIRTPTAELSWIRTNLPLRGRARLSADRWTLSVVTRAAGRSLLERSEVRAGSLMLQPPGAIHEGIYGGDFSVVCIGIQSNRVPAYLGSANASGAASRGAGQVRQTAGRIRSSLIDRFEAAAQTLRRDVAFRESSGEVERLIDELLSRFALAWSEASRPRDQRALRAGAAIVCDAEAVLAATATHALSMDELSEAVGVAKRSLSRAFHLVLGIGPATYLRRHRLSEARRALLKDCGHLTTVAEVAGRYGFRHLGRFSAQYRALFNELPHVTHRTAPPPASRLGATAAT